MFAFFLSSGLFLGWSLGANDASNVFGTAVGAKMIRFRTAAIYCSVFIILGAVVSGAGASHTLGKLGAVNALGGAFIVALSSALSVYFMTLARFPVSTSQAIVGAIIGWNFFTGALTDVNSLTKIVSTWILCPVVSALIAIIFYKIIVFIISSFKIHMFTLDRYTRNGLLLAGIFGSYSLGANNIANVMGVFIPVSPLSDLSFFGLFHLSAAQQLFLIGGVAIAIGVLTYSKRVMNTVGSGIMDLSPVAAFVAVLAHSIVLFFFSSQGLERFLLSHGLPAIPLVPVSSSQAIVGAVLGMGLLRGGKSINWQMVGGISSGWIITPVIAALISFVSLFFMQNVFMQKTFKPVPYQITEQAAYKIDNAGFSSNELKTLMGKKFESAVKMKKALSAHISLTPKILNIVLSASEINKMEITMDKINSIDSNWISDEQIRALEKFNGQKFMHQWQFAEALGYNSSFWQFHESDIKFNENLNRKFLYLYNLFER
ncbi:MAG: inorganic phosphate transporter [Desulfobacula sp.]|uniref:inorganic phosphate transporter n=2 Tax=Desulfobacula sp. TaxID=2593537 RepID=UPI001D539764|nr:inorganic phosphate transporter [Desulfobacula sp.]MBT4200718.1 inorganic phosphate transporter [Desulfobacula sp.]MBT4508982.1 inorganic phosphate transporter [Desulfobacula sp.]MBT5546332.1 inorganic phosphate transporter [Desulfobacula sp.]MBT7052239.1 inorganic phosphate transporter [Desulfobacula sp.]